LHTLHWDKSKKKQNRKIIKEEESEKPMINLVSMNGEELNEYLKLAVEKYAKEKVDAGTWRKEDSMELSYKEFKNHLPEGISTKGHYLFNLEDGNTRRNVGMIWIELNNPDGITD
jgi:hypothetical protein